MVTFREKGRIKVKSTEKRVKRTGKKARLL